MINQAVERQKIVFVEDEEILSNLIVQKFEQAGYCILTARDGETGSKLIREEKPDLVLLDMLLPKKSGFEILEDMHAEGMLPKTPVIIISNSGQQVEIDRALRMGVRDYLVKVNFDPSELLAKVKSVLDAPKGVVPKSSGVHAGDTEKREVLVVEDDIFLADLLCRKLNERFAVYQASETKKAYELLEANNIMVICLDVILPGMDGITFLRQLKSNKKFKDIPVLIISNLGQREEIDRGMEAGAADYLIKANVSLDEIVAHVEKIVQLSSVQAT